MKVPRITILFVDDERSILAMFSKVLEKDGYAVVTMANPLNAIGMFEKNPCRFDLLITDMSMPEMDGDRLVEKMLAIRHDLPVIVYSGFLDLQKEKSMMAAGVKACLQKPVPFKLMAKTVRDVMSASMSP